MVWPASWGRDARRSRARSSGSDRPSAGAIEVFGRPATIRNPNAAARLGIVYVTEDRKAQGLLPNRSGPGERHDLELAPVRPLGDSPAGRRGALRPSHGQATRRPTCGAERRDPHAERRQPAEGADRPSASGRAPHPDPGRADSRRRHRRQAGDLCGSSSGLLQKAWR